MKFRLISVGKVKEKSIQNIINDFSKRINISFIEIKDSNKKKEAEKLIEIIEKINNKFLFVLSEEGEQLSSIEFSKKIKKLSLEKEIVFVIGGPEGLDDLIKNKADLLFSLSKMTLTHEMAKLFLIEQIYRAVSIIQGKKYHKA
ncbi:23S rRNA (pseudouridine(1915)-N(3))-methyltransferase RlmH [archaeon]|jgi:23S rRNA (pseudouridine1915-N3)-methyltransferase|nr:23S rRNA (pseudouridine(1915)-N(3))-methyltransferase RlmH [archaeon]MBT4022231.1 23S rRNA (pseudouridine(1915)-N(3))-methyltransferase RlmH [archaeon]MBT4272844.1 23S rRNA (pseudouridine(1915)-N(3))-methyltransferase RlmH [archaeon]MBT4461644.1 23S rRNA (pseudouridine(1915)-N(3))-methyltransferase RlmH [archaeon]MBT4857588.1 23S rRNA (pseudouridine(1915)-N(3))-methyltransferase RlmH [archaeon]